MLRYCESSTTCFAVEDNIISVLHVSRAFSLEALQTIYKTSLFYFDDADTLRTFVDRVPEQSLRIIGNLRVRLTVATWKRVLLTFQLIDSCILNSLPGLSHLNVRILVAQGCSSHEWRVSCTIEEPLLNSAMLPQLRCANLELTVYSRSLMDEVTRASADNYFDIMRHLIVGPTASAGAGG